MSLPVAILAGGFATRLLPVTERIPKVLLEVAGKPFAVHQIELLKAHGFTKIVYFVGHLGELVKATLGTGEALGVELDYEFDGPQLLGTGGALRRGLSRLGNEFLVLYGDSYLECGYNKIVQTFERSDKLGLMTLHRNQNQWDRSNVLFRNGTIVRYDKVNLDPEMEYIDYGLGVLKSSVLAEYPEDSRFDLASVYQDLVARGELAGYEVAERFFEIGSKSGLEETRKHLDKKRNASSVQS